MSLKTRIEKLEAVMDREEAGLPQQALETARHKIDTLDALTAAIRTAAGVEQTRESPEEREKRIRDLAVEIAADRPGTHGVRIFELAHNIRKLLHHFP